MSWHSCYLKHGLIKFQTTYRKHLGFLPHTPVCVHACVKQRPYTLHMLGKGFLVLNPDWSMVKYDILVFIKYSLSQNGTVGHPTWTAESYSALVIFCLTLISDAFIRNCIHDLTFLIMPIPILLIVILKPTHLHYTGQRQSLPFHLSRPGTDSANECGRVLGILAGWDTRLLRPFSSKSKTSSPLM